MKRRLWMILSTVLIVILASSTIALAAGFFTKDVTASVTVLTPTPGLEVYSDAEATTPVTALSFGDLYPGDTSEVQTVYVKNTGQLAFSTVDVGLNVGASLATYTFSEDNFPLDREAVTQVDITMTISSEATPNPYDFILSFEGAY